MKSKCILKEILPPQNSHDYDYIRRMNFELSKGNSVVAPNMSMDKFLQLGGYFQWANFSYGLADVNEFIPSNSTITVCVLTYNNEVCIRNCIKNARRLADEVVIVDSGSTDRTLDIVHDLADKIIKVSNCNNYSQNRNIGIDNSNSDWIFMLDSDEALKRGDAIRLRKVISWCNDYNTDVVWIPRMWIKKSNIDALEYYVGNDALFPDSQARMFRNNRKIHYINNIHEWIRGGMESNACLLSSNICSLLHFKYWIYSDEIRKQLVISREKHVENGPDKVQMFPEQFGLETRKISKTDLCTESIELLKKQV